MRDVIRRVGRYEVLREIGRGGMATVHLARQTELHRLVALKELDFRASDPSVVQRFLREARLAGSLSHPNIVTVLDYFEHDGTPYIAMEYVERGSLRPYVGTMTLGQICGVIEGLLAGLAHGEQNGIVHRDLKPENLMVTSDGRVKIADFGIAKATTKMQTGAFLTATGTTVGTPTYMAPEQAMAQDIGPWTDLYSVGCMAFELFTGRVPFHDSDAPMAILLRHVNEPIAPVKSIDSSIDQGISDWVERMLVKDPKQRTQSASEAWDDFEEIAIELLGPRWRREARLLERAATQQTPKPLTSTPFEAVPGPYTPPPQDLPPGPMLPPPDEALRAEGRIEDATADQPDYETFIPAEPARPPEHDPTTSALEALRDPGRQPQAPGPSKRPQPPERSTHEPPARTGAPYEPRMEGTIPPSARTTAQAQRPSEKRRAPIVLLAAAAAGVVVVAVAIATLGSRDEAPPRSPQAPPRGGTLSSGPLALRLPAAWKPAEETVEIPGLELASPATAAPGGRTDRGSVTLGVAAEDANNFTLLGPAFVQRLGLTPPQAPDREVVSLGPRQLHAYHYNDVVPQGLGRAVDVYAVPTSRGVATVACVASVATASTARCDDVAATISVRGPDVFDVGPDGQYAQKLDRTLGGLASSLKTSWNRLDRARRSRQQGDALATAAAAFGSAARPLGALKLSPADGEANARLFAALREAANTHRELSVAAREPDRPDYRRWTPRAERAQRAVQAALVAFDAGGYRLTADLPPKSIPSLVSTAAPIPEPTPTATQTPAPTQTPDPIVTPKPTPKILPDPTD